MLRHEQVDRTPRQRWPVGQPTRCGGAIAAEQHPGEQGTGHQQQVGKILLLPGRFSHESSAKSGDEERHHQRVEFRSAALERCSGSDHAEYQEPRRDRLIGGTPSGSNGDDGEWHDRGQSKSVRAASMHQAIRRNERHNDCGHDTDRRGRTNFGKDEDRGRQHHSEPCGLAVPSKLSQADDHGKQPDDDGHVGGPHQIPRSQRHHRCRPESHEQRFRPSQPASNGAEHQA